MPAEWPAEAPEDWKGGYATPVEAVKAYRLAAEAKTAKDRVDEAGEKTRPVHRPVRHQPDHRR